MRIFALLLILSLIQNTAQAQDAPVNVEALTVDEAVSVAIANDATLKAAVIDLQRTRLAVTRERERLVTTFIGQAGYTYGDSAARSRNGEVSFLTRNALTTSAGVTRTFEPGTTASATLTVDRSVDDSVAVGNLGAGYNVGLRLEVSQPWLRGFGEDVVMASVDVVESSSEESEHARKRIASALLRDVLTAYWELWYAQEAEKIRAEGLALAQQSLADGEFRVKAGAMAEDALLPLLTEIASSEEDVANAKAEVQARSIALSRLTGLPPDVRVNKSQPALPPESSAAALVQDATMTENAHELSQLRASIQTSRASIVSAEDATRWKLDTNAWLQIGSAGYGPSQTLEQFFTLQAVTVFVGLRVEGPLDFLSLDSEAQRAHLAVQAAEARLTAAEVRYTSDAEARLNTLSATRQRITLAERTASLARASVDAQQRRFKAGEGTALDVARVVQQQREADLRVLRATVDLALAHIALDDLRGALLERLQVTPE